MRILATSDWHLGNLFHGNDRLHEHEHFLAWLVSQIAARQPDALLIAGDVFDNANPSAAAQEAYYSFLNEATQVCPDLRIVIIAGNHDSAYRLEAPRALLTKHNIEVRGAIHRQWISNEDGGVWEIDYDDLMVDLNNKAGERVVVLAVPYLRNDIVQGSSYSAGVNKIIRELTARAREKYPETPMLMMAHLYVQGADIAMNDASERILIGGQEEVNIDKWAEHPDYLTCGHIHKRQHIRNTDWGRYTGSVLPMSFAETNYRHGVDMVSIKADSRPEIEFIEYQPQHRLHMIPAGEEGLSPKELIEQINKQLPDRNDDGELGEDFVYLMLRVKLENMRNEDIRELEEAVSRKNAVLCKIQKVLPTIDLSTIVGHRSITTIDDIISRNPLDTLRETFKIKHKTDMSENQENMLTRLLESINMEKGKES